MLFLTTTTIKVQIF